MSRTPTRRWLAWVSVLAFACLAAASSLTKDDVIRMAKAGQSEQAMLDAIHVSHAIFDLTANDIADLRQAGVSDKVINTMTQTGPSQPEPKAGGTQEGQTGKSGAAQSAEGQAQEPSPPPVAYPVYPLYYPAYYPAFNPFFPFFGGFFFSFEFIHVSRLFTVFPFSRTVIVVTNPIVVRGASVISSNPIVFSTPRTLPRGSTVGSQSGRVTVGRANRPLAKPVTASRAVWNPASGSPRFGAPPSRPWMSGPHRPTTAPRGGPHFMPAPGFGTPPFFHRQAMSMPPGGFGPMGGMRSFGMPHAMGGGQVHGGHH